MKRILYLIFGLFVFFVSSAFINAADYNSGSNNYKYDPTYNYDTNYNCEPNHNSESTLATDSPLAPVYEPIEDDLVDAAGSEQPNKTGLIPPRPLVPACELIEDDWVNAPCSDYLCKGYYQELPAPQICVKPGEPIPITITSQRGEFKEEGLSTLEGQVHLIQGTRQIFADKTVIRRNANTGKMEAITATGHVKLFEPGIRLQGTRADIGIPEETKYLENAQFRLYRRHARGTACSISTFGQDRMILKDATYTTCAPGQNTWELRASNVDLNKVTGRGRARHARMYVKDVPIFYFPYVDFPIDDRRQSGFLFPIFGGTNNSGFELATPYYWNIAPNYDATFTPRLYTRRGLDLEGKFRYLTCNSMGELQGAFMPYDRLYKRFKAESLAYHPLFTNNDPRVTALNRSGSDRTAFLAKHNTTFNKHFAGNINYQTVGDDNYFMDFSNTLNAANTTQLLQQGDLTYKDRYWDALFRMQKYQTLHPFNGPATSDPYERLPQFSFANFYPDQPCGIDFNSDGEFDHFAHKVAPITGQTVTTGERYHFRPSISLPLIAPGWYIKPRLQCDVLSYNLTLGVVDMQNRQPAHPGRSIPMFDLDSGLIFEREFSLCNTHLIQTLEPRAYYLYVPYRNQNSLPIFDTNQTGFDYNLLYRDNRFNGLDRLGDANQLTLGLTSRFLDQCSGRERLSLTVGEIFYFKQRLVTVQNSTLYPNVLAQEMPDYNRGRSPLVGLARYRLLEEITLNGLVEWDTYEKHTNKRALWLQYQPSDLNVVNVGYQYLRENPAQLDLAGTPQTLNQTDFSFAWEITRQWRVLGRWHYDLTANRSMDILAGIEQQGCCTAVRLSYIRFLQPNAGQPAQKKYVNGVFLQFVFKGFASVGHNRLSGTTTKAIPGYKWRGADF